GLFREEFGAPSPPTAGWASPILSAPQFLLNGNSKRIAPTVQVDLRIPSFHLGRRRSCGYACERVLGLLELVLTGRVSVDVVRYFRQQSGDMCTVARSPGGVSVPPSPCVTVECRTNHR
ncbi:MAG: hypothetical protein MK364_00520, partial [Pirellulales bacterium]|nr:hypothetical protein [Pirellulales bacterium]